jgi:hypothetical protein
VRGHRCHAQCPHVADVVIEAMTGFDHGVGHPLLLLYDAKTPHGQKVKEFKGLDHDSSNAFISLL